jgi:hypothetical protein
MNLLTKEDLISRIKRIYESGWHKSVKKTYDVRNDGAVGNTLEYLLGIKENNLPIPNTRDWELKGQRSHSTSLVTLKHIEPSPQGAKIVSQLLLPNYGWKHKLAGTKYPETEMSFRSTTSATGYTKRGFTIAVDQEQQKVKFVFNPENADASDPEIADWLKDVDKRIGLAPFNPEPYWAFEDLKFAVGSKIKNCFYVIADSKIEDKTEYFLYKQLFLLYGFLFEKFLNCIINGVVLIDFDARTGHNHGTKFRIKQDHWPELYNEVRSIALS